MPAKQQIPCPLCGAKVVEEVEGFDLLLRVTSDSRIWAAGGRLGQCRSCGAVQKPFDQELSHEVDKIYATYELYFQGNGTEQKVFSAGSGRPRSEVLLKYLFSHLDKETAAASGRWLDLGCGTGHLLRSLAAIRPNWRLFGADIDEKNRARIEEIAGVQGYFSKGLDDIHEDYDFISISHVLEHVPTPLVFLRRIFDRLTRGGYLLIAVPNWRQNPFDLLVADHCLHFTFMGLRRLVQAAGFQIIAQSESVAPKELVMIARAVDGGQAELEHDTAEQGGNVNLLSNVVDWLHAVVAWADAQDGGQEIGLLGTALAATWLDRSAARDFAFFVDEDPQRAGGRYLGRPVLIPTEVPENARVLLPMPYEIAMAVSARLNQSAHMRFLPPPPPLDAALTLRPVEGLS